MLSEAQQEFIKRGAIHKRTALLNKRPTLPTIKSLPDIPSVGEFSTATTLREFLDACPPDPAEFEPLDLNPVKISQYRRYASWNGTPDEHWAFRRDFYEAGVPEIVSTGLSQAPYLEEFRSLDKILDAPMGLIIYATFIDTINMNRFAVSLRRHFRTHPQGEPVERALLNS